MTMYPPPVGRPPASANPVHDYLAAGPQPGVPEDYVVLPKGLVESMPLPWQQHMAHLLAELHHHAAHLNWPHYRVVPSRVEKLVDLDEEQLAEVGAIMEIDSDGELVYRERNGGRISDPESRTVMVSCADPIPAEYANANQNTPPRGFPAPYPGSGHPSGPLPVQSPQW
jgi:hypothetical protein